MVTHAVQADPFGGQLKAAIVEDDQFVAATFAARLTKHGVDATVFHDLESARAVLFNTKFDFAIVDLGLPDGNGMDLLKEIRGSEFNPDLPVIIATTNEDEHVAMQAYGDCGAMLVSRKPIAWSCLEFVIQSTVLDGSNHRKRIF